MRIHVFFHDECPKIGTGWRPVSVEVGRKWVKLKSGDITAKLSKEDWAPIARHGIEIPELLRKRRRRK